MYGNTLFKPGQLIFINPSIVGFGSVKSPSSAARQLGLGGYHLITKVESEWERGKFETTLHAIWETFGLAAGSKYEYHVEALPPPDDEGLTPHSRSKPDTGISWGDITDPTAYEDADFDCPECTE